MKELVTQKATGPVLFRFFGDEDAGKSYAGIGRSLLGQMKGYMNLAGITSYRHDTKLTEGVVIRTQSNANGLAAIDEIWISVPLIPVIPKGGKDICLGFIARLTVTGYDETFLLAINVKEPGQNYRFMQNTSNLHIVDGGSILTQEALALPENETFLFKAIGPPDVPDYAYQYPPTPVLENNNQNPLASHYGFFKEADFSPVTETGELYYTVSPVQLGKTEFDVGLDDWIYDTAYDWVHVYPGTSTEITDKVTTTTVFANSDNTGDGTPPATVSPSHPAFAYFEAHNPFPPPLLPLTIADGALISEHNTYHFDIEQALAPCLIVQAATNPITRYFCSDYVNDDGITILPVYENDSFAMTAVCSPGKQVYKVPASVEQVSIDIHKPSDAVLYPQGLDVYWSTYPVDGLLYTIGNKVFYDKTYTGEYLINRWEMTTKVPGGDYDIDVLSRLQAVAAAGIEFDVDIKLIGSRYPGLKYHDKINQDGTLSLKKAIVTVGKEVNYVEGGPNPHIRITANEA